MEQIKVGDVIETPRFLKVRIGEILNHEEAYEKGYTEPTHWEHEEFVILGKLLGANRMAFALVEKKTRVLVYRYEDGEYRKDHIDHMYKEQIERLNATTVFRVVKLYQNDPFGKLYPENLVSPDYD